jgi:hypothetical protein
MLLLAEGQTGETWEPSKKAILFHKYGSIGYTGISAIYKGLKG